MNAPYEQVQHKSGNNFPLKIYKPSGVYLHWHDEYEFLIVDKGEVTCIVNGEALVMKEHSAAILQSGVSHSIIHNKNAQITAIVASPSIWINKTDENLFNGKIVFQRLFNASDNFDCNVIEILKDIENLYNDQREYYEFIIKAKFTLLFGSLIKNGRFSHIQLRERKRTKEFQMLINYIHSHYTDKLSLNHLSNVSFYSPTYIIQLFKKYTNLTPAEYIIQYRLSIALEKLQNSTDSNLEIALCCGFNSESYFIQAFKKRYGITPKSYRRKHQR